MLRNNNRAVDEMRPMLITPGYMKYAEGSCLVEAGDTKVICTASVDYKVPPFLKDKEEGWLTAEYSMLPRSAQSRIPRDSSKGKVNGRAQEIQRLIGRSLRSVINFSYFPGITILIDCDVINADGGTRTASITGAYVAAYLAFLNLIKQEKIEKMPFYDSVAAISIGIVNGEILVDLDYSEDSTADLDFNFIMTGSQKIIEIQGCAEKTPIEFEVLDKLYNLSKKAVAKITELQNNAISNTAI
ncbi:MAG: ribonuclease PH [Candidatus Acidulodesulfobacterium acidiphilum]|uniref:Ribonuclease PH n=1 Tax=Candidatus Acidulodesulfobacterium acidiphilum TaxID=2597224 RepID=A0A520XGM3_9DELT|nr:MAG: ribonuclease PH [Candidatus Acidulodesulfobacterium acidiphilum]